MCIHDNAVFPVTALFVAGTMIAVGSTDGKVGLWDLSSKKPILVNHDHTQKVSQIIMLEDKPLLYSTGHDGYLYVRDYKDDRLLHSFISCTCPLSAMAIDGPNIVYLGAWDGHVKRVDLNSRTCTQVMQADPHGDSPVRALLIVPAPPPPPGTKKPKKKKGDVNEAENPSMILLCAHVIYAKSQRISHTS